MSEPKVPLAVRAEGLRVGAAAGCEVAVIESKPGIPTERNAARLGFGLAYARLVFRAPRRPVLGALPAK